MRAALIVAFTALCAAPPAQDSKTRPSPSTIQLQGERMPARPGSESQPEPLLALDGNSEHRVPIHTQDADPMGGEYGTWATGSRYKVSFHGDATFIPYLGGDYPENQPWSWRTTSVRAGSRELLTPGEQAVRDHSPYRYRYCYGQVEEIWDVRADGLEQSFVIGSPIAGAGDLVVQGKVTTALRADAVVERHGALDFFDANGQHILTYGRAIAFDAAGRQVDVTTSYDGGSLSLRVESEWLRDAAYPVTIDPILTPTRITFGSLRESADIATDVGYNRMIVFLRLASSVDRDLHARIYTPDYTTQATVFSDVTSNWSHDQVRVACTEQLTFACVFARLFGASAQMRFHVHDANDLTASTVYGVVPSTGGIHDWRADIGGTTRNGASRNFLVVYQRDAGQTLANTSRSEIWATRITTSSPQIADVPFQIIRWQTGVGNVDMERPAVAKKTFPSAVTEWFVVWQEYNNTPTLDDWDVCGRMVTAYGNQSLWSWIAHDHSNNSHHQLGPVVDGAGGRYCVAYTRAPLSAVNFKTGVTHGMSVHTERVDWQDLTSPPVSFDDHTLIGPSNARRWRVGDISGDVRTKSFWALTSVSDTTYGGTGAVYVDRVGYNGVGLEYATLFSAQANHYGDPGGIAHDHTLLSPRRSFWLPTWMENDTSVLPTAGGTAHELYVTSFEFPGPHAPTSETGSSCSPMGLFWDTHLQSHHAQQIGNEYTRVGYYGAPAGSLNFVGLAIATANNPVAHPLVASGCRELIATNTAGFLGYFPVAVGSNARMSLPLPEFLGAGTLYFQAWSFDPATNLIYSSKRLEVPIVK